MNTRKKSKIWFCSKEELEQILNSSKTFTEVLSNFGLRNVGSNYKTLVTRLKFEDIDYTKFKDNKRKGGIFSNRKQHNDKVFVENSNYSRCALKLRIIKQELIKYKCSKCGILDKWQDEKLVLILDHINGIPDDNRLENLRFLCPNCNSQTSTFAGRNVKYEKLPQVIEKCLCGKILGKTSTSKVCRDCVNKQPKPHRCKVERPGKDELENLLSTNSMTAIGKQYNVSDVAVRKWAKSYRII